VGFNFQPRQHVTFRVNPLTVRVYRVVAYRRSDHGAGQDCNHVAMFNSRYLRTDRKRKCLIHEQTSCLTCYFNNQSHILAPKGGAYPSAQVSARGIRIVSTQETIHKTDEKLLGIPINQSINQFNAV